MAALRLVIANILVFLILKVVWMLAPQLTENVISAIALPSDIGSTMLMPWTIITYMFVHINFWHLLVNVLWLTWFGSLLGRIAGTRIVIASYIVGGIAGVATYLLFAAISLQEHGAQLIGASAATLSVITFTLIATPNKRVDIPLIGAMSLKWAIAIGLGAFVCMSLGMTAAQFAAHAGGIIAGAFMAMQWRIYSRNHMEHMKALARDRLTQQSLVEKARTSGYSSLSKNERLQLFNLSNRPTAGQPSQRQ